MIDRNTFGEDLRILIAEKDHKTARQVHSFLAALGFHDIHQTTTLSQVARGTSDPDVVILDLDFGRISDIIGIAHDLSDQGVEVVFLSHFKDGDIARATRSFECLEKPLSLPRLRSALQRSRFRHAARAQGRASQWTSPLLALAE